MQRNLSDILTPAVEALGFELWGHELVRHGTRTELWVYVDSEQGVTLDECAVISRQVSATLDVADPISGCYQLHVSSPGMDRVFFKLTQYQRYIGHCIKVRLRVAYEGKKNMSGVLLAADERGILLRCSQENEVQLQFEQIEKAHLVPDLR